MVVQFIVFLTLSTLICRGTDISKCFSESLGIRDNESRLYYENFSKSLTMSSRQWVWWESEPVWFKTKSTKTLMENFNMKFLSASLASRSLRGWDMHRKKTDQWLTSVQVSTKSNLAFRRYRTFKLFIYDSKSATLTSRPIDAIEWNYKLLDQYLPTDQIWTKYIPGFGKYDFLKILNICGHHRWWHHQYWCQG